MLLWPLILSVFTAAQATNGTTTVNPPPTNVTQLFDNSAPLISKGNVEGTPNATRYHFTKVNFETGGKKIPIIVFKVDFDRNVFFTSTKNSSEVIPVTGESMQVLNTTAKMPQITVNGEGTVELICDGINLSGRISDQDGPPQSYLVAPPTSDPGSTLLNTIFGGAKMTEALIPNRFAIVYAGEMADKFNETTKCTVRFTTDGAYKVTGFKGESPTVTLNLGFKPPQCRYEDVIVFKRFAAQLIEYGSNITSIEQATSTEPLIGAITTREAFNGCKGLINSWLSFTTQEKTIKGSKECLFRFEDPKWKLDPCCNQELQNSMCCLPKDRTVPFKVVESVKSDVIKKMCTNPTKVSTILSNAVEASKSDSLEEFNPSTAYNIYLQQFSECFSAVFQTSCTTDTDCVYSGKCAQNEMCAVDYSNPGPALVKCFLLKMDPEFLLEFQIMLMIPTVYDTVEDSIRNTTAKILQVASIEDCAGPGSGEFRKKTTWAPNADGNYAQKIIPGNKEKCLAEKQCSFQPWQRKTQDKCLAGATEGRSNFCGQCDGSFCNPITQFSTCVAMELSPADCTAEGGVMNMEQCEFAKKNTAALCLTGINCDSSTNDWRCGRTICAKTTAKTENDCKAISGYVWAAQINQCIKGQWDSKKASCVADSSTFVPGVFYRKGLFDTEAACPATTCDNMQVIFNGGNSTECASVGYCDAPCARCRSDKYDSGVCAITGVDKAGCQTALGNWQKNNCFSSKTKDTCTGSNEKWLDCGTLKTQDTCTKDTAISSVIQCRWNSFDSCKTKEDCVSAGSCNDFEFGNGKMDGACVYIPLKQKKCAPKERMTRSGNCIKNMISTSTECDSVGGKWTIRAKTKDACVSLGNECDLGQGRRNNMDVSTCDSCLAKSKPLYQWSSPNWKTGKMVSTSWRKIEWNSINTWSTVLDQDKLMDLLQGAASQIIARKSINRFKQQYSLYTTIFEYVSCDCLTTNTTCFGKEDIKSPLASCNADPAATSECGGVEVVPGMFPNGTAISIDVQFVSSASYVNETVTLLRRALGLENKRATTSFGAYEVVKNGDGSIIGQIVGNGKSFSFGTMPTTAIKICLDVDPNIAQDTSKYPKMDFVKSIDSTLDVPLGIKVTLEGSQFCGTVPAFKVGIFVPVLRKDVALTGSREKAAGTSAAVSKNPSVFFALFVAVLATILV